MKFVQKSRTPEVTVGRWTIYCQPSFVF